MAKTLLKMVLGVLLLSGLFFFMLQLWEKSRSKQEPIAQQDAGKSIKEIVVKDGSAGAIIEISDVTNATFSVSALEKGLQVDFPDAKVALSSRSLTMPHPMIASIETTETGVPGEPGAKVEIAFASKATFKTRQTGQNLIIDLAKEEDEIASTPVPTAAPKKKVAKVTKRSRPARVSKPARPKKTVTAPKKAPKSTPKQRTEEDEFLAQLGITDGGSSMGSEIPVAPVDEQPMIPVDDPAMVGGDDPFAGDSAATQMAANGNKPLEKNFDAAQVAANLPPLTDLQVVVEDGITKVRIAKGGKTKHKIFPKRNPDRIVIDFQNVLNQLPPEIQGVAGSRVDRVRTSQFTGPEGTISRIELFLNGPAQVDRTSARSSTSAFELPIP